MNAAKEAKAGNIHIRDGLRKIDAAFLSTREVSSKEYEYRCMPELWLTYAARFRKIFPATAFVETDLADKQVQTEPNDLDDDNTDIFKSNIIERYCIRPASIPAVDNLCLAQFAAYCYNDYRKEHSETIHAQPEVLTDDIIEIQHSKSNSGDSSHLPKNISLMNTNETMKWRKVKLLSDIIGQIKENNLNCFSIIYLCYITHGGMNLTSLEVIIHMCQNSVN